MNYETYASKDLIDTGIKELVKELRNRGYDTVESCAGHLPANVVINPVNVYGWIDFDFPYEVAPLVSLFHKFGMTDVRVMVNTKGDLTLDAYNMEVRFAPVGKMTEWSSDWLSLYEQELEDGRPYCFTPKDLFHYEHSLLFEEVYRDE